MTRTGQDAIDYARSRIGPNAMPEAGYCLAFTRECFAVPAYYASAADAARGCNAPHRDDRNPPAAVPVWFHSPSIYDHVAFYVGPNEVISTWNDDVRAFNGLADIERQFDARFAGWGEDINEVTVHVPGTVPPPTPEPEPQRKDPDMLLLRIVDDGRIMFVSDTLFQNVPNMDRANALARILGPWIDVDVVTAQRIHDQINENVVAAAANLKGQWG